MKTLLLSLFLFGCAKTTYVVVVPTPAQSIRDHCKPSDQAMCNQISDELEDGDMK